MCIPVLESHINTYGGYFMKHEVVCKTCGSIKVYASALSAYNNRKRTHCVKCKVNFKKKWKDELTEEEYEKRMDEYKQKKRTESSGESNNMYGKTIFDVWVAKYGLVEAERRREEHRENSRNGNTFAMAGRSVYSVWLEKYGEEEANKRMEDMAEKKRVKSSGSKNPMFGKPSPMGSGYGWKGWYKGWYFRSLRELSYMINVIEKNNHKWEHAEERKYSINYTSYDGSERTYRADFIIDDTLMVEIKPKRLHSTPLVMLKKKAAEEFCKSRNMVYSIVDCDIDIKSIFDLFQKGEIILESRYKDRFTEYMKRKGVSGGE
jgi:hypothetical protein